MHSSDHSRFRTPFLHIFGHSGIGRDWTISTLRVDASLAKRVGYQVLIGVGLGSGLQMVSQGRIALCSTL